MDFVPTLNFNDHGLPNYNDYINQIEDRAPDATERIKLINQLLLNEEQQPFMYQALLHKYGIETESYNKVWSRLMGKGHASIDQVIAHCNLKLSRNDIDLAMTGAAYGSHKEIVKLTIIWGARSFNTSMERAALKGHKEIVEMMMAHGATSFTETLLSAARRGYKEIVELVMVNSTMHSSYPMIYAAIGGHKDIVELMITQGASDFNSAMVEAAEQGHKEIVELMIDQGATNFKWGGVVAARSGHREIVDLLQPYIL